MMALVAKMIEGRGDMLASMSEGNNLTANMNIGGTFVEFDHTKLKNRDAPNQHKISSIENLASRLNEIDGNTGILTNSDIDKLLGF